jgi:hypothetical protein
MPKGFLGPCCVVIFGGLPLGKKTTSCVRYRLKNAPKNYSAEDQAQ